ncbi:arylsulfatase B-like isoform X3 [Macrobrachium nipponense]|uniref:arylsulfatase B-like isoform X3 n=1 Tax=Macrobrachium nipponense TaxID=159736 RepID=UPI0030C845E6
MQIQRVEFAMKAHRIILLLELLIAQSAFLLAHADNSAQPQPHIILIVADDLGWNDVSWHNPKALTPHLEQLARGGVLLNQSYVQPICTPTRSALLTGRYPYTIGRQRDVLWPEEPTGLTIKHQLLPQVMKSVGYSTHAVGKWHLGFCSWDYTPTMRGFDTFWGYYTGAEDYYHHVRPGWHHVSSATCNGPVHQDQQSVNVSDTHGIPFGYDFRNNTAPEYSVDGQYSTYVFSSYIENLLRTRNASDPMFLYLPFQSVHSPLQVPENYTRPFDHIDAQNRRVKLGMVLALDEAVDRVVQALKDTGHYDNSIIIFTSDNGGPTVSAGNNWPLRGNKTTLWEGGTRVVAFVHSPLLPNKGTVSDKLVHVTDWFATIAGLAGGTAPDDTSGYDQWQAITTSAPSPRAEMIYNIDMTKSGMNAGIRMGDYKLLVGNPGPGEWTPPPEGESGGNSFDRDIRRTTSPDSLGSRNGSATDSQLLEENSPAFDVANSVSVQLEESTISHGTTDELEEDGGIVTPETDSQYENEVVTLQDLGLQPEYFPVLRHFISNDTEVQLFNVTGDPEERNNIAPRATDVVKTLMGLLQFYLKDYVEPDILPDDPAANPSHWNNTWTPGWCRAK